MNAKNKIEVVKVVQLESGLELQETLYKDGSVQKIYLKNGLKHRDDGPAYVYQVPNWRYMCKRWYQNGKLHRGDGPAVIENSVELNNQTGNIAKMSQESKWYVDGQLHNEDGPAIEKGVKEYNCLHFIGSDNTKDLREEVWCQNNKLHRENEPAVWYVETVKNNETGYSIVNRAERQWHKDGEFCNPNGPTSVELDRYSLAQLWEDNQGNLSLKTYKVKDNYLIEVTHKDKVAKTINKFKITDPEYSLEKEYLKGCFDREYQAGMGIDVDAEIDQRKIELQNIPSGQTAVKPFV